MVNKFYSEGEFLLDPTQSSSHYPKSSNQEELKDIPIKKAQRIDLPMPKILDEIYVP